MSTLKEEIQKRRLESARSELLVPSHQSEGICLRVDASDGKKWIFPWSHFVYSRHEKSAPQEILTLCFVAYEITVSGQNLDAFEQGIANLNIGGLRSTPQKYKIVDKDPVIEKIAVCRFDDLRKNSVGTLGENGLPIEAGGGS